MLEPLMLLIALAAGANLIYAAAGAATIRLIGGRVDEISLGLGPSLLGFRLGGVNMHLRLAPLGAAVVSKSDAGDGLAEMAWPAQVVAHLAGPAALLFAAGMLSGVGALEQAARSWTAFARAVWPLGSPEPWAALLTHIDAAPLETSLSLVFCRLAAWNLTPAPPLAGGMAVVALVRGLVGDAIVDAAMRWLAPIGFLALFAVALTLAAGLARLLLS